MSAPPRDDPSAPPAAAPTAAAQGARAPRESTSGARPHLAPLVVFFTLTAALIDFSTDTPHLGPFYGLGPASQARSALCAAGLALLALLPLLPLRFGRVPASLAGPIADIGLRLLPVAPFVLSAFWSRRFVDPADGRLWNAFVLVVPVVFAAAAALRLRAGGVAILCAAAGIVVRSVHFARFPIDVGADMLPLVRSALEGFVAGRSPYAYYDLPAPLPLTYYPLTWLAYLPAFLLRLDLRVTNVAAELAIPAALALLGRVLVRREGPGAARAADVALLLWGAHFLLPSSVFFDRITTAPIAWAVLVWAVGAVALGLRGDALLVGAAAGATPLAAIALPAIALVWWRRLGLRRALGRLAAALALAAAIIAPFYFWSPRGFLDGALLWFNDLDRFPRTKWDAFRTWRRYVGFSGLFWEAGRETWLKPLQALGVAATALLLGARGAPGARLAAHLAAAFIAFMVVNPVHWPYFYQPALACGLVAIATAPRR